MDRKIHHKVRYPFFVLCSLLLCLTCISGNYVKADLPIDPMQPTDSWQSYMTTAPGSGTVDDPYIISSAEEFAFFANQIATLTMRDVFGEIVNDIDLGAHEWFCKDNNMVGLSLEGNNHTISNVYMNQPKRDNIGLFANPLVRKINNLSLSNVNITGAMSVGAFVGSAGPLTNCHVLSGSVTGTAYVGGLCGNYSGNGCTLTGCSNYATITATGSISVRSAGLAGGFNSSAINCMNFGDVISYNGEEIAGLVYGTGTFGAGKIENCYVECNLVASNSIGGLVASGGTSTIQNSGFKGKIICTSDNPVSIGSMIGQNIGSPVLKNSFGIAEILLTNAVDYSSVYPFGFSGTSAESSYSHCVVTISDNTKVDIRKYATTAEETSTFVDWAYSPYINSGHPFPTGMFAVGGFMDSQDVKSYLKSKEFDNFKLIVHTLRNSTYGTNKYVELGKYPQTYVGVDKNNSLENWYKANSPTIQSYYNVDQGVAIALTNYPAYLYTDRNTYVRVQAPIAFSSAADEGQSVYENGVAVTNSATWFKVEPIRWLILNYEEMQTGASPVVIAEKAIASNTTWNKVANYGNNWATLSNARSWLNEKFYENAFTTNEKTLIAKTTLRNNSQSSTNDGSGTESTDKVWLLSYDEMNGKYFTTDAQRCASPTDFAVANNCLIYTYSSCPTTARPNGGTCYYWLRSANSTNASYVYVVDYYGHSYGNGVNDTNNAVRPALTLNI